jgi:hypothetical protein
MNGLRFRRGNAAASTGNPHDRAVFRDTLAARFDS